MWFDSWAVERFQSQILEILCSHWCLQLMSLPGAPLLCMSFTYAYAFKRKVMGTSVGKHDGILEDTKMWPCALSHVNISNFPFPVPFPFFWSTFFFKLLLRIRPSPSQFCSLIWLCPLFPFCVLSFFPPFVQFFCIDVNTAVKVYACKSSNSTRKYLKLQAEVLQSISS